MTLSESQMTLICDESSNLLSDAPQTMIESLFSVFKSMIASNNAHAVDKIRTVVIPALMNMIIHSPKVISSSTEIGLFLSDLGAQYDISSEMESLLNMGSEKTSDIQNELALTISYLCSQEKSARTAMDRFLEMTKTDLAYFGVVGLKHLSSRMYVPLVNLY
jgi:hypothetical protein